VWSANRKLAGQPIKEESNFRTARYSGAIRKKFHMCSFRQGRHDGQTKSCCIFVDLIHLTSCGLKRNLRTSLDVCCLVLLLPGFLFSGGVMAKCTVLFYPRSKRKTNAPTAETQECGFYESAFLADRGCFAFMHQRRKPRNAPPDQQGQRKMA
jgi:hypothetical protein